MPRIIDTSQLIQALTSYSGAGNGGIAGLDMFAKAKDPAQTFNVQQKWMHKESRVAGAAAAASIAGAWTSAWQFEGVGGSGDGAVPTTWANPSQATGGALGQAGPAGGNKTRSLWAWGSLWDSGGTILVYDRLAHMGGLDATLTTAQNVNGGSAGTLSRYDGVAGNFLWYEVYTQIGATATTITASYTNEGNLSGHTTQPVVFGGTGRREAQRIVWASLQQGDKSIKAVTSVTVLATTGTAGNFGVTVAHPLFMIPCGQTNSGSAISFEDGPIQEILNSACVALAFIPVGASNNLLEMAIEIGEFA